MDEENRWGYIAAAVSEYQRKPLRIALKYIHKYIFVISAWGTQVKPNRLLAPSTLCLISSVMTLNLACTAQVAARERVEGDWLMSEDPAREPSS